MLIISLIFVSSATEKLERRTPSELDRKYGFFSYKKEDENLIMVIDVELAQRRKSENYFPQTQGATKIIDWVYVQKKGYMEDLIYFPMPSGGIKGKILKLRLEAPELEIPLEIRFIVNQK